MEISAYKEIIEELKEQWKRLWWERIDDKVRAEGIANRDFSMLFIEKGTVIFATKDFKLLSFREILEQHRLTDADRIISPSPYVGGWRKFIKTMITNQKPSNRSRQTRQFLDNLKRKQQRQLKKGGRGWLHL